MKHIHVYVYYRIAPNHATALQSKVEQLFLLVAERSGVRGRLSRRTDDPDTWMEVYESVSDTPLFVTMLSELAQMLGLDEHLTSGSSRHVEIFEDFASSARVRLI